MLFFIEFSSQVCFQHAFLQIIMIDKVISFSMMVQADYQMLSGDGGVVVVYATIQVSQYSQMVA